MLKNLFCQFDADLIIKPEDPILIRSGYATVFGPHMAFVRTFKNGKEEVFLPGSSLKGVIRSHAERICRTLGNGKICIPYLTRQNALPDQAEFISCGDRFEQYKELHGGTKATNKEVYKYSCAICRGFGSTSFAGRFSISDAYAEGVAPQPEARDGVAIDRFTGGAASRAKFDLEVVTKGIFKAHLAIRNFELWQLGLLGYIIEDLQAKMVRIGAGKSRGLGRVCGEMKNLVITYYQQVTELKGLGSFLSPEEKTAYGVSDLPPDAPFALTAGVGNGVRWTFPVNDPPGLFAKVKPLFNKYIDASNWLAGITSFVEA